MLYLRESQKWNFYEMLSILPTKSTKESSIAKNTPIFCVNSSAGKIASSIESITRTRHIEVAHLWIQQEFAKERIKVHCVNTENPAADIFTEVLCGHCLKNLRKDLD